MQDITTAAPELMTLPEVADWLRKSQAQLRWMRHNGSGPKSGLIGGRIMFRRGDVQNWLDAQFDGPLAG